MQASEKEPMPVEKKEEEAVKDTNGEKNGEVKEDSVKDAVSSVTAVQKLSLGEISAIDGEIAKAKTDQLQLLHNVN